MLEILRAQLLDTVGEQLRDNEPPIVRETLKRLMGMGYSEPDARNLIAGCMAAEMFDMIEENRSFNQQRYQALLTQLPELPISAETEPK